VSFAEPGRAEHADAWGLCLDGLETAQEFQKDPDRALQVGFAVAPTREEQLFRTLDLAQQGIRRARSKSLSLAHETSPATTSINASA